jgi:hypothetical protein
VILLPYNDLLFGDFELGFEFIKSLNFGAVSSCQFLDCSFEFLTLNDTVDLFEVRKLIIEITVFVKLLLGYLFRELKPLVDRHIFGMKNKQLSDLLLQVLEYSMIVSTKAIVVGI